MNAQYLIITSTIIGIVILIYIWYTQANRNNLLESSPITITLQIVGILFLIELTIMYLMSLTINNDVRVSINSLIDSIILSIILIPIIYIWLKREAKNIHAITDNVADAVIVINEKGIVEYFNVAAQKMFGYSEKEIIGKSINILIPPPYKDKHDEYIDNYLKTGVKHIIGIGREIEGLRKDGSIFPIYIAVSEIRRNNKVSFVGIIQDISERKESEANQKKLIQIIRAVNEINQLIVKEENEDILLKEACQILANTRDYSLVWIGLVIGDVECHIQLKAYAGKTIHYALLLSEEIALSANNEESEKEPICRAVNLKQTVITDLKTDNNIWFAQAKKEGFSVVCSIPMIYQDAALGVINIYSHDKMKFDNQELDLLNELARDIAFAINAMKEKKKREIFEKELDKSNKKFQDFFYHNPEPCIIWSIDGIRLYVNQAYLDLTGYSEKELLGKNINKINIIGTKEERDAMQDEIMSKGYVTNKPTIVTRKSGEKKDILYSAQLIDVDGEPALLGIARDITEQKQAENELIKAKQMAEAANMAKSEFLANMSHEMRTPMNTIVGMADMMAETNPTKEQQEYIEIFKKSSEQLQKLINDILSLSKIEAGDMKLEVGEFKFSHMLDEIKEVTLKNAKHKNLELHYTTDPAIPDKLIGDEAKLKQVLLNIIGNGIKFTETGSVNIEITQPKQQLESNNEVEIFCKVSDTGIGIAPEKVDVIFHTFTQIDSSITRRYGGTGLGLIISKRLINMMGGDIWVESEVGKGSTFYFTVKLKAGSAEKAKIQDIPAVIRPSDEKKTEENGIKNILLVDDAEDNRQLVILYLKKLPYKIDIAENGQIAVDKYKSNKYDLVVMDIQMPVMDGYTATKEIRKWEKENKLKATPIVALTANAFKEDEEKSYEMGCTGYLSKPIHKNTFLEAVKKYLA